MRMAGIAGSIVLAAALAACNGGGDGSFCDAVREFAESAGAGGVGIAVDSSMSDEEIDREVERFEGATGDAVEDARRSLSRIEDRAPADIAADVRVVVDQHRSFVDALDGGDLPRFDPSAAAATQASFERVRDYTRSECGVEYPVDVPTAGDAPPERPDRPDRPAPPEPPAPPAPPAPPEPPSP